MNGVGVGETAPYRRKGEEICRSAGRAWDIENHVL